MHRVDPVTAREGTFIKSFPVSQYQEMLNYGYEIEMALWRNQLHKRVVYTRIGMGAGKRTFDTWQIFVLPEA